MNTHSRLIGLLTLLGSAFTAFPLVAQNAACQIHDQMCIYHGIGKQMGYDPSGPTSITATANWDQANDADLHALLPTGNTYSAPTEALAGYPIQLSEPFYPDVSGAHIYPNHYESQINGGAATATHSGDAGGGEAPYPGQPGCDPSIQSSVTCEAISVQGDVPSGVYSYAIHAFPASGSSFPLTNFSIDVRASGNMVLVSDNPGLQINPETGLIRQTGSFQGSGATTSQLDVYALNVGHAGHVGGVTIPQMELVSLSDGTQRYQPVEPLLFDETPSIQDQIAGAFLQRDQQVAYYEGLREQEKQRLAYLAELARARAAYNKWLADQEKAQAQQEKLVYMACPAPLKSCVPSYVQGEKFVLAQPAIPAPCNPEYASCVTPPAKFWEPTKSWEQIVSETYQQSVVLPKNDSTSDELNAKSVTTAIAKYFSQTLQQQANIAALKSDLQTASFYSQWGRDEIDISKEWEAAANRYEIREGFYSPKNNLEENIFLTLDTATLVNPRSIVKSTTKLDFGADVGKIITKEVFPTIAETKKLKTNMLKNGVLFDAGEEAHHIVAQSDPRAKASIDLLKDAGIDIQSPANGVPLPGLNTTPNPLNKAVHRGDVIHSDGYYNYVENALKSVPKEQRLDVLRRIAKELELGIINWID